MRIQKMKVKMEKMMMKKKKKKSVGKRWMVSSL